MPPAPKHNRRWFRFSLGTMFLVVTVFAVWLGVEVNEVRRKARAVSVIESCSGKVTYDYEWSVTEAYRPHATPPGPRWLRRLLGEYYRANVVEVQLFAGHGRTPENLNDDAARSLIALSDVKWLVLMDTRITDAGLEHLKGLKKLERLDLEGSLVTEKGVETLKNSLPNAKIYY
jgi:hypothetical protein